MFIVSFTTRNEEIYLGITPCNPSYLGGREQDLGSKSAQNKQNFKTLSQKYPKERMTDRVAQAVECLSLKQRS
jgi:hypothetical protein